LTIFTIKPKRKPDNSTIATTSSMPQTLEQKIGQLFLLGFEGDTLTTNHPIVKDIAQNGLGGVILFDRLLAKKKNSNNIISAQQLQELTRNLQNLIPDSLLIAVDQEGGKVSRFKKEMGFSTTPSAQKLGEGPNVCKTSKSAKQTAEMLRATGVNFNLAPVVDLNIYKKNPIIGLYERSFSESETQTVNHAKAWIKEHRKKGVLSCLKHFPGHGSSHSDSHLGFVDITTTWQESELLPYEHLIKKGYADSIMVGHLINRKFDTRYPATLSKTTLQSLVREKLHFDGVLISDDMQMKAITDHYGLGEGCCKALAAGIDMLIVGNNIEHNPNLYKKLRHAIFAALDQGLLTEDRIEQAWKRIQTLKSQIKKHHGTA
jgi:beta-N-acetylhexosaminidase